jgi:two-component system NarL family sensor kinase
MDIHRLQALKEIAEHLNEATEMNEMLENVLHRLLEVMKLETGWILFVNETGKHELIADVNLPAALQHEQKRLMCTGACWCTERFVSGRLQKATNIIECKRIEEALDLEWNGTGGITHHASVPLRAGEERLGVLNVAAAGKQTFTNEELALLEAIALQIGTTIKRMKLVEQERKYDIISERNRLARDLHDSVKQLLFTISLTAKGMQNRTKDTEFGEMLAHISELSTAALQEMHTLIWQLRPEGLEEGIATALTRYGEILGLEVDCRVSFVLTLPSEIEEALWRIGQEALNNCKKYAKCNKVIILLSLHRSKGEIKMVIQDDGVGFESTRTEKDGFGLKSMKERAELMKGTFQIQDNNGTTITVTIPWEDIA